MRLRPNPNRSERLEPVRVSMRAVFVVGTALWLAAGTIVAVLLATAVVTEPGWLAICATGAVIGVGGWFWARWRRW